MAADEKKKNKLGVARRKISIKRNLCETLYCQ